MPLVTGDQNKMLAWAIVQLGGSIVLSEVEQRTVFMSDWVLSVHRDEIGRMILEAKSSD